MELLVVAIVALIVFGPERLPEMARKAGSFVADIRRAGSEMRSEFQTAFDEDEDDDHDVDEPPAPSGGNQDGARRDESRRVEPRETGSD